jgi:DNA-binding CsgD family transcriptional regulator
MALDSDEIARLLSAQHFLLSASSIDDFLVRSLRAIPMAIGGSASFGLVNLDTGMALTRSSLPEAEQDPLRRLWERETVADPIRHEWAKIRRHVPITFSERMPKRSDRQRLDIFQLYYDPLGIEHQLIAVFGHRQGVIQSFGVNRPCTNSDFSQSDREMMQFLSVQLEILYELARRQESPAVEFSASHFCWVFTEFLYLTPEGLAYSATARCWRWIHECFPSLSSRSSRLPDDLRRWIDQQILAFAQSGRLLPPLRNEVHGIVSEFNLVRRDTGYLLILTRREPVIDSEVAELLRLSLAEVKVLRMLISGLDNRQIAGQLCRARGTVKTQLASIYQKFGVSSSEHEVKEDTRVKAVGRAIELLNHHAGAQLSSKSPE